jgi:hypothetical protein
LISLLSSFLFLLIPLSGVVSGGRSVSFALKSGLIPSEDWLYIPGLPASGAGTFTSISCQTGSRKSFSVVSSGETAGIHPLVASRVTENGYAAQLFQGGLSIYAVKEQGRGSFAASFAGATLDLRGWPAGDPMLAGEYSSDNLLMAFTEHTGAAGVSFPVSENIRIGPACCADTDEDRFWIQAGAVFGPLTLVSAPAIDELNCYRRFYGLLKYGPASLTGGWNGEAALGELSLNGDDYVAAVEFVTPGAMLGYRLCDSMVFVASHREEGWLQGEIQGKFRGFTVGTYIVKSSDNHLNWGFSAGIDVGTNGIRGFASPGDPWTEQMAVTSLPD